MVSTLTLWLLLHGDSPARFDTTLGEAAYLHFCSYQANWLVCGSSYSKSVLYLTSYFSTARRSPPLFCGHLLKVVPTLLIQSFGFSSTLLLPSREGERRFLKSRSNLASNSCDPYFKHTVKYLASDLPRRSSDDANPMMITCVFKGFPSISWMVPTEMFCFYPAIHYVPTFLRTSLQNPCSSLYYPPPRTFPSVQLHVTNTRWLLHFHTTLLRIKSGASMTTLLPVKVTLILNLL